MKPLAEATQGSLEYELFEGEMLVQYYRPLKQKDPPFRKPGPPKRKEPKKRKPERKKPYFEMPNGEPSYFI